MLGDAEVGRVGQSGHGCSLGPQGAKRDGQILMPTSELAGHLYGKSSPTLVQGPAQSSTTIRRTTLDSPRMKAWIRFVTAGELVNKL